MYNNMLLVNSEWDKKPTFKMIPTRIDCPYNEAIYDPETKALAVISKEKKETFHFLPRLDDNGDILRVKPGKTRSGGKPYQEQRVNVETYYEYYISDRQDIDNFIKTFADNTDEFDYSKILDVVETEPELETV